MKDGDIAKLVNNLRQVAIECHDHGSLREQISRLVVPAIQELNSELKHLKDKLATKIEG